MPQQESHRGNWTVSQCAEQERRNIEEKIELLNVSLKKLEYRLGTHIQLEPRPIRDADITEFQGKLRECVEGSFDDSADANEARFVRIKEFVVRLRDEENRACATRSPMLADGLISWRM